MSIAHRRTAATAGRLASAGAAAAALALTVRAAAGERELPGVSGLARSGAVVLLVGAVAAAASARPWGGTAPVGFVTVVLALVGMAAAVSSAFVLLNLIDLALTGSVSDRDGNSDRTMFAERLVGAILAALFVAAALSWRRRTSGGCIPCGGSPPCRMSSGSIRRRTLLRSECVGRRTPVVPPSCTYLAVHARNMFVLPGHDELYEHDGAGLAGELGAPVLLLGLVRPWGMVFPRWTLLLACRRVPRILPLTPVWLVAPTLAPYGVGSVPYAVLSGQGHELWGLGGAASLAFGGHGCALMMAAVSYWLVPAHDVCRWPAVTRSPAPRTARFGSVHADVDSRQPSREDADMYVC